MRGSKPRLAFISPLFLFPNDAGGKIRTTNILRGLKSGAFDVTLLSPATESQRRDWAHKLDEACDRFVSWRPPPVRSRWRRAFDLRSEIPVNVLPDCTPEALSTVQRTLAFGAFDICVFDFVHSTVLLPKGYTSASVCFTHNVEAEIFQRHATQARNPVMRQIWRSQHKKMQRFEAEALQRFTSVVAVSDRDARHFTDRLGVSSVHVISTGVDLDFFGWREPSAVSADSPPTAIFTGSMDWEANLDAVRHFLDEVWPRVTCELPDARFFVVGRRPPPWLIRAGQSSRVRVTGFVDDVRPYVHRAHVFVIPLRVGGGTRIKAFEAMAMGCPVVSTSIGIEGLDVIDGEHCVRRDSPGEQAQAIVELLSDASRRSSLSRAARRCVEARFGHRVAAAEFEKICLGAMKDVQGTA